LKLGKSYSRKIVRSEAAKVVALIGSMSVGDEAVDEAASQVERAWMMMMMSIDLLQLNTMYIYINH